MSACLENGFFIKLQLILIVFIVISFILCRGMFRGFTLVLLSYNWLLALVKWFFIHFGGSNCLVGLLVTVFCSFDSVFVIELVYSF